MFEFGTNLETLMAMPLLLPAGKERHVLRRMRIPSIRNHVAASMLALVRLQCRHDDVLRVPGVLVRQARILLLLSLSIFRMMNGMTPPRETPPPAAGRFQGPRSCVRWPRLRVSLRTIRPQCEPSISFRLLYPSTGNHTLSLQSGMGAWISCGRIPIFVPRFHHTRSEAKIGSRPMSAKSSVTLFRTAWSGCFVPQTAGGAEDLVVGEHVLGVEIKVERVSGAQTLDAHHISISCLQATAGRLESVA